MRASAMLDRARLERAPSTRVDEHEFRIHRGEFVGVVEPHGEHYWFLVRDLRRERPTIHGFGVDFPRAVNEVSHLLDVLATEH